MSPKMPQEYFDFRKQEIIKAAWECFTEKGLQETTMRDISKRLNLSTGVIYNYFKGKDEIMEAIQSKAFENRDEIFEQMAKKETTHEAIHEYFKGAFESCSIEELKIGARGNISLWTEALRKEKIKQIVAAHFEHMRKNMSRFIKEGMERGEYQNDLDAESVSVFYISLFIGLQVQIALVDDFNINTYKEDIKKMLFENK